MPNIVFAPKPMVDPYAGQAGEMLGELISTIGQISNLRQQRNQTNAVLDIMKNPDMNDEQRRTAILGVARSGGDVMRNMVARQYMAEALVPEHEKKQRAANLASTEALTAWRQKGGARAAGGAGGIDEIKKWQDYRIKEETAKMTYQAVAAQPGNKIDSARVAEYDRRISQADKMIARLSSTPGKSRAPGPPIGLDDSTALGYPPQRNPSVFNQGVKPQVAPSTPPSAVGGKTATAPPVDPSRLQHAFVGMGETPGEFARPSNDRPGVGAMGAGVGMGVGLPPGSPSAFNQPAQTKADAAIAKEIGPPSPEGLDEIWNELSEEERQTAIAAMNQGVTAQQIVSHLKAQ